jgi:hypothetical protein
MASGAFELTDSTDVIATNIQRLTFSPCLCGKPDATAVRRTLRALRRLRSQPRARGMLGTAAALDRDQRVQNCGAPRSGRRRGFAALTYSARPTKPQSTRGWQCHAALKLNAQTPVTGRISGSARPSWWRGVWRCHDMKSGPCPDILAPAVTLLQPATLVYTRHQPRQCPAPSDDPPQAVSPIP